MKAVFVERSGPPEVLTVRESSIPLVSEDGVLIRARALGVNFADVLARQGLYPDAPRPPFVPGYEIAGTVEKASSGGKEFKTGDRVLAMPNFGGYAEYVAVPRGRVVALDDRMSFDDAAAIPVNYLTAYQCLFRTGALEKGDRVLIHSAAGGVGLAAVQMCRNEGAEIYATVGSDEKAEFLKRIGVEHVVNYRVDGFVDNVRMWTQGHGVDVVLDPWGGASLRQGFRLLRPGGRLVSYGVAHLAGRGRLHALWAIARMPRFGVLTLLRRSVGVYGVYLNQLARRPEVMARDLAQILQDHQKGKLKPVISKVFPLTEAAAAHRHLEARANIGKVLLKAD